MNTNKTNKIIIISLITIIALIVIFLITYMNTDLLKSEKELFFKYTMQLGEKETNNDIGIEIQGDKNEII